MVLRILKPKSFLYNFTERERQPKRELLEYFCSKENYYPRQCVCGII